MTTELDLVFVPLAKELLDEFGKTVTITDRAPVGSYNPKTGTVVDPVKNSYSIKIIPPDQMRQFYIAGDLVENGTLKSGFAAQDLPFTPVNGMTVDIDGRIWTKTEFNPIYSGDEIALYEMTLEE